MSENMYRCEEAKLLHRNFSSYEQKKVTEKSLAWPIREITMN